MNSQFVHTYETKGNVLFVNGVPLHQRKDLRFTHRGEILGKVESQAVGDGKPTHLMTWDSESIRVWSDSADAVSWALAASGSVNLEPYAIRDAFLSADGKTAHFIVAGKSTDERLDLIIASCSVRLKGGRRGDEDGDEAEDEAPKPRPRKPVRKKSA